MLVVLLSNIYVLASVAENVKLPKKDAPAPPNGPSPDKSTSVIEQVTQVHYESDASLPSVEPRSVAENQFVSQIPPTGLGAEMVERVRLNTGLSYANSKLAVASVLTLLGERMPCLQSVVDSVVEGLDSTNVCLKIMASRLYKIHFSFTCLPVNV